MSNVARVAGQAANTLVKPLELDELFSTYLYTGNGSTQTITNGIDLAGEGGLVVIKRRDATGNWGWYDTERGPDSHLKSNGTNAENTQPDVEVKDFNSDGFDLGTNWNAPVNTTNAETCSWTFRKTPKFFDIVTYTGNGPSNTQNISHNLGSAPGMLVVKATSTTDNWHTWHRGFGDNGYIMLNSTNAKSTYTDLWDDTAPTATHFTVSEDCNTNNVTYVAYLFAHNDGDGEFGPDADQDAIKCGSYTGSGSAGNAINLGFEPQWVLIKSASRSESWHIWDTMRGIVTGGTDPRFFANTSGAEVNNADVLDLNPTGFTIEQGNSFPYNYSGDNYIYMAIRRPTAVPESATEVFDVEEATAVEGTDITTNFPVDTQLLLGIGSTYSLSYVLDRLRGVSTNSTSSGYDLEPNNNNSESSATLTRNWGNTGFQVPAFLTNFRTVYYNWKRAPKYFDVVAYNGDGATFQNVPHNLGVAPEMMWVKRRSGASSAASAWQVYHKDLTNAGYYLILNEAFGENVNSDRWNNTAPTESVFTVGISDTVNLTATPYIAYLFASLAGISKVGSVTHSGTTNVDCGFTSGARFILLKSTGTGDWYVWDSVRGIVAGNDPYLLLNTTAAEVTNTDYIDPLSSGFTITSNFTAGDYIFYAIA